MNLHWLVRMTQWARHPPPLWRVRLVAGVVAACLALVAVEYVWGWPEWLTVNGRMGR